MGGDQDKSDVGVQLFEAHWEKAGMEEYGGGGRARLVGGGAPRSCSPVSSEAEP